MAVRVSVTSIEDLGRDGGFYDGIAVVDIKSDVGSLKIRVPFEDAPTLDEAAKIALAHVKVFAVELQNAIVV